MKSANEIDPKLSEVSSVFVWRGHRNIFQNWMCRIVGYFTTKQLVSQHFLEICKIQKTKKVQLIQGCSDFSAILWILTQCSRKKRFFDQCKWIVLTSLQNKRTWATPSCAAGVAWYRSCFACCSPRCLNSKKYVTSDHLCIITQPHCLAWLNKRRCCWKRYQTSFANGLCFFKHSRE